MIYQGQLSSGDSCIVLVHHGFMYQIDTVSTALFLGVHGEMKYDKQQNALVKLVYYLLKITKLRY